MTIRSGAASAAAALGGITAIVVGLAIHGVPTDTPPAPPAAPSSPAASFAADTLADSATLARDALATLPVADPIQTPAYSRRDFGSGWSDDDGDGCDTRAEIIARDATGGTLDADGCPDTATLTDPYTAAVITADRADIDHVVALGDAWRSGAAEWTTPQRRAFANDPANLLAVSASANRSKGDDSADQWLPVAPDYQCPYVARQVAVKAAYRLTTTAPEHATMAAVLATCPDQPLPTENR